MGKKIHSPFSKSSRIRSTTGDGLGEVTCGAAGPVSASIALPPPPTHRDDGLHREASSPRSNQIKSKPNQLTRALAAVGSPRRSRRDHDDDDDEEEGVGLARGEKLPRGAWFYSGGERALGELTSPSRRRTRRSSVVRRRGGGGGVGPGAVGFRAGRVTGVWGQEMLPPCGMVGQGWQRDVCCQPGREEPARSWPGPWGPVSRGHLDARVQF